MRTIRIVFSILRNAGINLLPLSPFGPLPLQSIRSSSRFNLTVNLSARGFFLSSFYSFGPHPHELAAVVGPGFLLGYLEGAFPLLAQLPSCVGYSSIVGYALARFPFHRHGCYC
eukprot:GHVT01014548.1.p1 GENE.GHVT01014548.1~~GHVT01014548.1.p1  ORF type:complete len:114 (+),score=6.47 GHVT01014548.1:129-470(+)